MTMNLRPIVNLLPLLALVGAACFAWAAPIDRRIESRISALQQQAELRFGAGSAKLEAVNAATDRLLDAWSRVQQPSDGDYRRVHQWLDKAFRATLPGRSAQLPRIPLFVGAIALNHPEGVVRPEPEPPAASFAPQPKPAGEPIAEPAAETVVRGPMLGGAEQADSEAPVPTEVAKPVITRADNERERRPAIEQRRTRSRWSRHPSAAPLDWQDPFVDDPSASANPLRPGPSSPGVTHRVQRPMFASEMAVAVNLSELSARVRGFNNAVRSLQQRLLADPAPDAFSLSDWADELERLDEERSFLNLYRDGLPPEASRLLPPSPSIEVVSELLRRRATDQLQSLDGRGAVEQRALETITARMSRLSAGLTEL